MKNRPRWVQNCMDSARADVEFRRRSGPHLVETLLGEIARLEALLDEKEAS